MSVDAREEELDRMIDQTVGWAPKVPLESVVGTFRSPTVRLSDFFRRGGLRFYQIGRHGARRPIFIGVASGQSVADCVSEHLAGTIGGRSTLVARRLHHALRSAGDPARLWVTQAPVTATAVDPADSLAVHATLLLLQSCLGAEVVNPGRPGALPRSVHASTRGDEEGEAMFAGVRRRLRQLAAAGGILLGLTAQPGAAGKDQRAVTELIETVVTDGRRKKDEQQDKTKGARDPVNWRDRPARRRRRR